ncbi:MAG: glycoside hydrolase family 26 protein [Streptosporangiaceae bacterium]
MACAAATVLLTSGVAAADTPLSFGLFESSNNLNYSFPVTPGYAIQYYGWHEPFQTAAANGAWDNGTETFAELQTCGNPCGSTGISLTDVIAGRYDTYLTNFAGQVRDFGHPVLLTFDHEMNGSWYPWGNTQVTPAQWIAAWQHVTTLISAIAPNVSWVWAPNIEQGAAPVASYWPGTGYPSANVSIVGLDGYLQNSRATWKNTFSQSFADVEAVSGGQLPFMLAETGVPAADSNAQAQIDGLVAGARAAGAQAVFYFDCGSRWSLTDAGQAEFINDVS